MNSKKNLFILDSFLNNDDESESNYSTENDEDEDSASLNNVNSVNRN